MALKKIFIDGKEGTTGLQIYERLQDRDDIEIIFLADEDRKDTEKRRQALNNCDIAILCLPDDAARQAVSLVENENVVIIDASTAHRTEKGWVYGLPELSPEQKEKIKTAKRIANPGCHASGFIALIKPLIDAGAISKTENLCCHSITGYSGGGKKMIASYEDCEREKLFDAPRQYGLTQNHKHLKEMVHITGLENPPVFCPIVSNFYSGMLVSVPLFANQLKNGFTMEKIVELYKEKYNCDNIKYNEDMAKEGFLNSNGLATSDVMEITVTGNEERMVLSAMYNNLGKGASGAAVQCLNLILGGNK